MGTVFCDNCGVSLLEESARFCRACGKPTPSPSETATKRFDQQPGFQTQTSSFGPSPTTPAYMAPFEFPSAPQTIDLNRTRKRNMILVATMLAIMIFALGGLYLFLRSGDLTPTGIPAITSPPSIPDPPKPPFPPPTPPVPGTATPATIDQELIYPGSKETMKITTAGVNNVLKLHTDDATSKVVAWYIARLKVTNKYSIAGQTMLQAGDTNVMIMGGDDGAEILITQSNKDSGK